MNLHKCDICGHLEEPDERFFHLSEMSGGDRGFEADVCEMCFNVFKNSEGE